MGTLLRDLRYGLRMLAKNPGFTAVAVLTLALGIGANSAIFSVVYRTLLRPLPYQKPDRLLILAESRSQMDTEFADASYPDYLDWVSQVRTFESLAGFSGNSVILTANGSPETVFAMRVTSNFFSTLGIKLKLGRDFALGEDRTNGPKVVILSHKFWEERFGGNPQEMGQTIRLDGEPYVVIGVLPKEFEFAPTNSPPLWVPLNPSAGFASRRGLRWMHVIGRLRQTLTFSQAFAEMSAINARLASAYPQENKTIHVVMQPLRERIVGHIRPLLLTLLGAVTFVLLIACANVAHLLLARGAGRRREIAIRITLGAGRRELLRQLLTESLLLAFVAGALGLLLSQWGVSLMLTAMPKPQLRTMPYLSSVSVDSAVLAFTLVVAIVTGVLFGLAPALQMSRTNVNEHLKEQSRGSAGSVTSRLRDTLVVAEIGLALMLLVGAGLMLRSARALLHGDPGFRTDKLLTFAIGLLPTTYKDSPAAFQFEQRFSERIRNLPGVAGIATVSKLPLTGGGNTIRFVVEGRPTAQGTEDEAAIRTITANYFDVMKIPLVQGRFFAPTDKIDTPRKLIVNQAFAKQYFPGEDLVGKRIRFTFSPKNPFLEIVGVVGNENADQLDTPMSPIVYTSFEQNPNGYFNCVVRTSGKPEDMISPIRGVLHDLDAELPLIDPQTMEQVIAQSPAVFLRRYPSYLIGSFAGLAVVLAMVGLYGLIAFSVAQRTREIGIRMALGAQSGDVLRLVLRRGMRLAVAGVACGVVGALIVTQLIRSLLFGVSAADPVTFAAVAALLEVVAIFASYVPARRATKVDPMVALRYE